METFGRKLLAHHYEASGTTRRTAGWRRIGGGPNEIGGFSLQRLRDVTRDLVRNNGYAQSALQTIQDDVVGRGIRAMTKHDAWREWSESDAVDADGRCDLHGITQIVIRTVAEAGECLVRRRRRLLTAGLPLPLQLQVLEPDHIDSGKHQVLPNGRRVIRGVEFDALGRRAAYWLFRDHPGSSLHSGGGPVRVPASEIAHVFRIDRPGQVRGVTWFASSLLRFKDYDDLVDSKLMQNRVAALFGVVMYDPDGTASSDGEASSDDETWEVLEPGTIHYIRDGSRGVEVVNPPSVRDFPDYAMMTAREIAAGIGVAYEDMTGDYTRLPFSAARMSRLRHFGRVSGWRFRMMVPQFLNPVWRWAMQASVLAGHGTPSMSTEWTAPGLPMIDPNKEGLGVLMAVRAGITTLEDEIQGRGHNNLDEYFDRMQHSFEELDKRGLTLDSDPRKMTQAGQLHSSGGTESAALVSDAAQSLSAWLGSLPPELADQIIETAGEYLEEAA